MAAPKAIERVPGDRATGLDLREGALGCQLGVPCRLRVLLQHVLQLLRLHPGLGSLRGRKLTALQGGRALPHRHLGFVDLLRELLHVLIEAGHLGGALLRLHGAHLLGDGALLLGS
jgi:hypothetical protein